MCVCVCQLLPPHGGWKGSKAMRALIFGRLRPWRSYRDEAGQLITTTAFPHGPPGFLWAGERASHSSQTARQDGRKAG